MGYIEGGWKWKDWAEQWIEYHAMVVSTYIYETFHIGPVHLCKLVG